ncbi:four-carbon acid sugar kinase family protein [Rhizobium sp. AU243]|uniref:four-carbon acid sugar kinase family protein n=1 Tax=Rhizobium sp. AU243 TaxID=2303425 RepID=UPI0025708B78|nr:four-carbon acid sugar kinase family protein [Rhizobium sp. AU243]
MLDQGCRQIVFKYCSPFDSTPAGHIGPVAEAFGYPPPPADIVSFKMEDGAA